jgi:cell division protein ZapA
VGQVTVRVNGYAHTIGCKDGEEAHVLELIGQIEGKTKLIRSMGGQFSEARMLLHVALLLADEASDLRAEMARLAATGTGAGAAADPRLAERLARIAERIEGLAGALDPQGPGAAAPGRLEARPASAGQNGAPAAGRG